jgi:hypothetical protein
MCTLRIEEAAPKLRAVLLRAADGKELSDDESLLLFRGLHILGAARDREACQLLLRLLRRPFDEVDALLGDVVTESLAKIVTGAFDDDIDALFALIIDGSIDGFIREALFGAATFLTWDRKSKAQKKPNISNTCDASPGCSRQSFLASKVAARASYSWGKTRGSDGGTAYSWHGHGDVRWRSGHFDWHRPRLLFLQKNHSYEGSVDLLQPAANSIRSDPSS